MDQREYLFCSVEFCAAKDAANRYFEQQFWRVSEGVLERIRLIVDRIVRYAKYFLSMRNMEPEMNIDKVVVRSRSLVRDTRGANLVEYIILVGVVAIIGIVAFGKFGGTVSKKIDNQADTVQNDIPTK